MLNPTGEDKLGGHEGMQIVRSAYSWVIKNHPALTPFLVGKDIVPVAGGSAPVPTAATDGQRIWVNLDYVLKIGLHQACALLIEEVMHIGLAHGERREDRNRHLWNVAADMQIASILIDEGFKDIAQNMQYHPDYHGWGVEETYHELRKMVREQPEMAQRVIKGWKPEQQGQEGEGKNVQTGSSASGSNPRDEGSGKSGSSGSGDSLGGEDDAGSGERDQEGDGGSGASPESEDGEGGDESEGEDGDHDGGGAGASDDQDSEEQEGEEQGGRGLTEEDQLSQDPGEELPGNWGNVRSAGEVLDYKGEEGDLEGLTEDEKKERLNAAQFEASLNSVISQSEGGGGIADRMAKGVKGNKAPSSWRDVLRNFLLDRTRTPEDDWSRPNRRYLSLGCYLPRTSTDVAGDVVVGLDMSGSINEMQLAKMVECLQEFLDEFGGITLHVIPFDTRTGIVEVFNEGDTIEIAAKAGGGTSFFPIFQDLSPGGKHSSIAPLAVIMFTDMGASIPSKYIKDQGMAGDVLWVDFVKPLNPRTIKRGVYYYDEIPEGTYATSYNGIKGAGGYVNMTEMEDMRRR